MPKWKKVLIGLSFSLTVILIFTAALSYLTLHRTLPDYNKDEFVEGLSNDVRIYRDSFAVPMIIARNDEDAAFALGYIHAQERLFQMDIARRAGEGRLSEIFGTKTLPFDKMFRTIGIYKNVKENYSRLNPLTKKILEAYSKGVNSFIEKSKGKYQIEFDALGYDPYPWKPEHSLIIAKLMGWELNISWWTDITFANLVQKLGEEKARELMPDFSENGPTIIPKEINSFAEVPKDFIDVDRRFRQFTGFVGTHIGSNNWVVDGNKSASGKPIIANDPHLAFTAPGKWYFVIIRSNDWNAEGFTLPGVPVIVIGKNQNIAWAVTNVMADDADFYVEKIDSSGKKYFFNNDWRNLETRKEKIAVKDSASVSFEVRKTLRGPIISDVHLYNVFYKNNGKVNSNISMRWTGLEFSDEIFAGLSFNKAKNWEDFKSALRYFNVPGQNFIYADKQGNIGYVCAAKLPLRSSQSPTLIYDGTTAANDWKGFVPYEEMPKIFNPTQHFIATANNKTVDNFKYHISNIWEPPSRIERITELLNSKTLHSKEDYKKYQNDFVSPYARKIVPFILSSFRDAKINDKNLKTALELFKSWDYGFDVQSQVPTIYTHFLSHLIKNIFEDELGRELLQEYVYIANVPYRMISKMLTENNLSYFDDKKTAAIENSDDMIRKSLADALTELESKFGKDITDWQWGEIHTVTFNHMFSGASSLLDKLINIGPYPIGGDGTTVFNTEYSFPELFESKGNGIIKSKKYANILGPSMRYIFDFADPDHLEFILPAGQSGNFASKHYNDMTELWLKGRYAKIPLSENEFINRSTDMMKLIPNRQ